VPAHRGAVLGLVGITNQGGVVLGSALGGLMVGLGGYHALAVAIAVGGAVAAGLATPLAWKRRG
jgi:predicted MFS family arabinose efflux permease